MNDIELTGTGNKYDWTFTETDLVDVNGNASLVSAIRHALLLQHDELEQTIYEDKGTRLEEILRSTDTDSATSIAKQTIEEELREIVGVQKAEVELIANDGAVQVTTAKITKTNGEEIKIGL